MTHSESAVKFRDAKPTLSCWGLDIARWPIPREVMLPDGSISLDALNDWKHRLLVKMDEAIAERTQPCST